MMRGWVDDDFVRGKFGHNWCLKPKLKCWLHVSGRRIRSVYWRRWYMTWERRCRCLRSACFSVRDATASSWYETTSRGTCPRKCWGWNSRWKHYGGCWTKSTFNSSRPTLSNCRRFLLPLDAVYIWKSFFTHNVVYGYLLQGMYMHCGDVLGFGPWLSLRNKTGVLVPGLGLESLLTSLMHCIFLYLEAVVMGCVCDNSLSQSWIKKLGYLGLLIDLFTYLLT